MEAELKKAPPQTEDELIEELAALEHERWAHWQRYLHSRCERRDDGSLVIPAALVRRWEAQIVTPYAELSDAEQDSDRVEVLRYWKKVKAFFSM